MTFENTFYRLLKSASVVAAATSLLAGEAQAKVEEGDIESYTVEYSRPTSLTEWVDTEFSLQKFDSSRGTLLNVEITIFSTATTSITATNNAATSSNGHVRTELVLSLASVDVSLGGDLTLEFLVPSGRQNYTLGVGESVAFNNLTASGSETYYYDSALVLEQFTGPGSIAFTLDTLTGTTGTNFGGNTDTTQVTTASGRVEIKYTYEAVPEPGTWAAMAMGAGVLFASRFRRKS